MQKIDNFALCVLVKEVPQQRKPLDGDGRDTPGSHWEDARRFLRPNHLPSAAIGMLRLSDVHKMRMLKGEELLLNLATPADRQICSPTFNCFEGFRFSENSDFGHALMSLAGSRKSNAGGRENYDDGVVDSECFKTLGLKRQQVR